MAPTTEFDIKGRSGRLQAYRWGAGELRYVAVLVHGYAEHMGRYEHVAQALVARGAAVYGVDFTGHGRSAGEQALVDDIEDLVADVETLVTTAQREHTNVPVVMIGHSMGGMVAARYAQEHSDALAALVLSGPAFGGNPNLLGLLNLPEIPDVPLDPDWLSRDPEVGQRYTEDPLVYSGPFKRKTLEALVASVDRVANGGDLGDLPTLWIHGEQDMLCPLPQARDAVERVGGRRLEQTIYPDARHEIFNETNQDEVIADVTAFVDRVLASAPATPS
jgi:alpha-beta hydrolase superfamily lysophospholipase